MGCGCNKRKKKTSLSITPTRRTKAISPKTKTVIRTTKNNYKDG